MSIALEHKRKVIAEREAGKGNELNNHELPASLIKSASKNVVPESLQKIERQLASDLETLKILKGDQQRDPLKLEMVEKYRPLCEWYMENFKDWGHLESLAWWLVWQVDLKDFEDVEPLIYSGVERGLTAPSKFNGTWQSWYCDLVKAHYSEQLKAEKTPNDVILNKVITDITKGEIVLNKPLKAKLFALYGKVVLLKDDHKIAAKAFEKALSFDEAVGVKNLLKVSLAFIAKELEKSQQNNNEIADANSKKDAPETPEQITADIENSNVIIDNETDDVSTEINEQSEDVSKNVEQNEEGK